MRTLVLRLFAAPVELFAVRSRMNPREHFP
jgi:hypothetical protein